MAEKSKVLSSFLVAGGAVLGIVVAAMFVNWIDEKRLEAAQNQNNS